ncbi:MAG: excinuclease ABC subunit UvrC [Candidatus Omnitrophota bacterium]
MVSDILASKIKDLPDAPGVYEFLDAEGRILYVGKALRLKRRVASYFQRGRARDSRLELLVSEARDIRVIRTASEAEALIYEAGLIKDHAPRFNIELKDDKSYPFLKLTEGEKFPRLYITRRKMKDGAVYYGPYVNVKLLKEAVSFMKKVFPLRTCRNMRRSVCLEYHIGQCAGPCEGKVSPEEYKETVVQLKKFLEGKKEGVIRSLEEQMAVFSGQKEYEKALAVKKRMEALTAVREFHDTSRYPIYGEIEELKNALGLSVLPVTIECFDISNIGGKQAVGSMVRFSSGVPSKPEYRKYRVKGVEGVDDYAMIREVVRRRYSRILEEGGMLPDLVLIDGGKGHLSAAKGELKALGLLRLPVISIAKEFNHIYTGSNRRPVRFSPGSRVLLLIQRIRDEAHRFAITYHRRLRSRQQLDTGLRKIKGIGPAREKALVAKFGNIENIRAASPEELTEAGIDHRTARAVAAYFRRARNDRTQG